MAELCLGYYGESPYREEFPRCYDCGERTHLILHHIRESHAAGEPTVNLCVGCHQRHHFGTLLLWNDVSEGFDSMVEEATLNGEYVTWEDKMLWLTNQGYDAQRVATVGIADLTELKPPLLNVWLCLRLSVDEAMPSAAKIGERTGYGKEAVKRAMKRLAKTGLFERRNYCSLVKDLPLPF